MILLNSRVWQEYKFDKDHYTWFEALCALEKDHGENAVCEDVRSAVDISGFHTFRIYKSDKQNCTL